MPSTTCPACGHPLEFNLQEYNRLFDCSRCNRRFSPRSGLVEIESGPAPTSVSRRVAAVEAPPARRTSAQSTQPIQPEIEVRKEREPIFVPAPVQVPPVPVTAMAGFCSVVAGAMAIASLLVPFVGGTAAFIPAAGGLAAGVMGLLASSGRGQTSGRMVSIIGSAACGAAFLYSGVRLIELHNNLAKAQDAIQNLGRDFKNSGSPKK